MRKINEQQSSCYTLEILKQVQQIELEIFNDFKNLCRRHNLSYFAFGGTAIGAVRHGGFIPWDDDIDVGMLRNDYERFLEIADAEYADKYDIVNFERYSTCTNVHTHWCKKSTLFGERISLNADHPTGIFLDIFPFDYIPDDKNAAKRMVRSAWFWDKLFILSLLSEPVLHMGGVKQRLIVIACRIVHGLLCLFRANPMYFYKKFKAISVQYRNRPSQWVNLMHSSVPFQIFILTEDLFPLKWVPFEHTNICLPGNVHNMLTHHFGDYMQLPPLEKRYNHAPKVICFDTAAKGVEPS